MVEKTDLELIRKILNNKAIDIDDILDEIERELSKLENIKKIIEEGAGWNDTDTLNKVWKEIEK